MVYAHIIVSSRTNVSELTYSVPAHIIPYIRAGSVVVVPLRRKQVRGVVVRLSRGVSQELRGVIKEIIDIDKSGLGFSSRQIKSIEDLAEYYGASLGEVAFHALRFPSKFIDDKAQTPGGKPTFIQAPWPKRRDFYKELIDKYSSSHSIVFAFSGNNFLINFLEKKSPEIIDITKGSGIKKLQKKLADGERFIAAGLQGTAFIPLLPQDFFVIDRPDTIAFKGQRRPYMTNKTIGLTRARNELFNIVLGADLIAVTDYDKKTEKKWRVVTTKINKVPVTIHNATKFKESILPSVFEEINLKNKLLFIIASKYWAPALVCTECRNVVTCDNCHRTVALASKNKLICPYCSHEQNFPIRCSECGGQEFIPVGEGSQRLYEKLKEVFSDKAVGLLSSQSENNHNKKIVVATEKILNFPNVFFDTSIVANMDRLLVGTSADGVFELINLLLFLATISKKIIIQTRFPDHRAWSVIQAGNIGEYFEEELAERRKYHLPPFGQKLALVGTAASARALNAQANEIYEKIDSSELKIDAAELETGGLGPGVTGKIIIFSSRILTSKEKHTLRSILPPSWYLDVEP